MSVNTALDTALATLDRGGSAVVQVAGDPGIGKTRLLAELAVRARRRKWTVRAASTVLADAIDCDVCCSSTTSTGPTRRKPGRYTRLRDEQRAQGVDGLLAAVIADRHREVKVGGSACAGCPRTPRKSTHAGYRPRRTSSVPR
jgi:hypothetical protein